MLKLSMTIWREFHSWKGVAVLMLFSLTGCSASLPVEQRCPPPAPIPAEIAKSRFQDANDYSAEVSDWLQEVQKWLFETQQKKTQ